MFQLPLLNPSSRKTIIRAQESSNRKKRESKKKGDVAIKVAAVDLAVTRRVAKLEFSYLPMRPRASRVRHRDSITAKTMALHALLFFAGAHHGAT